MKPETLEQDELLMVCQNQKGFLETLAVLTKDPKIHLGFDLPCCPKHQQKALAVQIRPKIQRDPAFFGIPTSSTIIQIQPRWVACAQLLKSKLAASQQETLTAE